MTASRHPRAPRLRSGLTSVGSGGGPNLSAEGFSYIASIPHAKQRHTCFRNAGDVPIVGSTATAHDGQARKLLQQANVVGAEFLRVADVEFRRLVQLGVTLTRGVGADGSNPLDPFATIGEEGLEMRRMGAVNGV